MKIFWPKHIFKKTKWRFLNAFLYVVASCFVVSVPWPGYQDVGVVEAWTHREVVSVDNTIYSTMWLSFFFSAGKGHNHATVSHPVCGFTPHDELKYSRVMWVLTTHEQVKFEKTCVFNNREFKKWLPQRQRQRHKPTIWLVERGKIIVLQLWHTFGAIFWHSLSKENVKFSYLRFWRQLQPAALNLSFFAFRHENHSFYKQAKVHFAYFSRDQLGIIAKHLT